MITILKVNTADKATYNYIHCPQCNNPIGRKHKSEKIRVSNSLRKALDKTKPIGLTCRRCKNSYSIITENT